MNVYLQAFIAVFCRLRLNHIAIITCFYTIQHNTPPDLVNYTFCYIKQNLFNCTFFHFYVLLQPAKPKNAFFLTKQQKKQLSYIAHEAQKTPIIICTIPTHKFRSLGKKVMAK